MQKIRSISVIVLASIILLQFGAASAFSILDSGRVDMSIVVRWCTLEGAPVALDPGVVGADSIDEALTARHERAAKEVFSPFARIAFRSGASSGINRNGVLSSPILRDPRDVGGNIMSGEEADLAVDQCRLAWLYGDPLYYDANNNGVVESRLDSLLSRENGPISEIIEPSHRSAPLNSVPANVMFVDANKNDLFEVGEHIYRDENSDGIVNKLDTLLSPAPFGTQVGNIRFEDLNARLNQAPPQIKFLDLIHQPAGSYNIGDPSVAGIIAVSANDLDLPGIGFPVHGLGYLCGDAVVIDDPSFYLPPGKDFSLFEVQLVAHEFGHALCLNHGDGVDDDMNGLLDDGDDPAAPFEGAGPGTLCDSNNVMQYCWQDQGLPADPDMIWLGTEEPQSGLFTDAQAEVMREHARFISDTLIDPGPFP